MSDPRYRPAYPSDAGTYAGSHPSSNAGAYGADDVGYPAQAGPYVYGGAPQPMDPYRNYGYAPHGPPGAYYSPAPPYAPDALSQRRYPPSAPMYSAMGFQGAPTGNMYHVPPPYPFGRVAYSDAPRMHGHGAQHDMSRPGALGPDANRPPPPAPPGAKNDHQMTSGPVAHRVPGSRGGWQRGRARGRASHAASHRASLPVASDAVCCHFLREMCHYGPRCRFSHADHGQGCCYGAQCRYGHGERPQSTALGADGPDSNTVSVAAPPDADQGITSVSVDGVVDAPAQDGDGSGVNADPIPPQQ